MPSPRDIASAASRRAAALDVLFLTTVIVASTVLYVDRLGFYHDDYHFLGLLAGADDQSFGGLLEAFRDGVPKQNLRPAQEVLFVGMYDLFGGDALPWHLLAAVFLAGMGAALYLLLRELLLPRPVAVAIPLLYAVLPHYASARFWPATFAELLSMLLLFVSLYAVLRAACARAVPLAAWLVLAATTLVVSVLAYEVAMPLFVLAPLLVLYRRRKTGEPSLRRSLVVVSPYAVALLAVFTWKAVEAREIGEVTGYELGYPNGFAYHLAYLGQGVLRVNAGSYGLGLPYVVGWIVANRLSWAVLGLTLLLAVGTFLYLRRVQRDRAGALPDAASSLRLLAVGIVVLLLGYAVFLTNAEILFRSAGADNRVAVAAALGVAIAAVGGASWLSRQVGGRRADVVFAGLVAALVGTGTLAVNTLADYWAEAWSRQQEIVADLRTELPDSPAGVRVILDGTCPEIGPAVVFVSTTDLTGALKMAYPDRPVEAGVVRDELSLLPEEARITNTFLDEVSSVLAYPYARGLYVYNASSQHLFPLEGRGDAERYRADSPPRAECPPVRSFAWGIDIDRWRIFA